MEVLSPLGSSVSPVASLTPRPRSLAGLIIGLLDNAKPNADVLLDTVAERLVARVPGATVRRWQKPGSSHPAAMLDEIVAASDVVLTGSAD